MVSTTDNACFKIWLRKRFYYGYEDKNSQRHLEGSILNQAIRERNNRGWGWGEQEGKRREERGVLRQKLQIKRPRKEPGVKRTKPNITLYKHAEHSWLPFRNKNRFILKIKHIISIGYNMHYINI